MERIPHKTRAVGIAELVSLCILLSMIALLLPPMPKIAYADDDTAGNTQPADGGDTPQDLPPLPSEGHALTEQEALCYLEFLYGTDGEEGHDDGRMTVEQIEETNFYRLITGNLEGEEELQTAIELLVFEDAQLSERASNIGVITNKSGELLLDYLESKVSDDIAGSVANDIINSTLHDIVSKGLDYVTDTYLMGGDFTGYGPMYDDYEKFWLTKMAWDDIKSMRGVKGKAMKYVEQVKGVLMAEVFAVGTSKGEMYNYYITYRNSLSYGEYSDLWMSTYRLYNDRLRTVEEFDSWLLDSWLNGAFDNSYNLWATEEREGLLEKFATWSYGLEDAMRARVPDAFDDVASSESDVEQDPSGSEQPPAPAPVEGDYRTGDWEYNLDGDGNATVVRYDGTAAYVQVPMEIKKHTVTNVDGATFVNTNVKTVVYPSTVTSIGASAFTNMSQATIRGSNVTITGSPILNNCSVVAFGSLRLNDTVLGSSMVVARFGIQAGSLTLDGSSLSCGTLNSGNLSMSNSSDISVTGDADIRSIVSMYEGDSVSVDGTLIIGFNYYYGYWPDSPTLEGGTVSVKGDLNLTRSNGYKTSSNHKTVLCGNGPQHLAISQDNRVNGLVLENPLSTVECTSDLALAGDGAAISISCARLDLAGHALEVAGQLTCSSVVAPEGSTLECAGITARSRGNIDAHGASITVRGAIEKETPETDLKRAVSLGLDRSTLSCETVEAFTIGMSGGSTLSVSGDVTVGIITGMSDGDLASVGGSLTIGRPNGSTEGSFHREASAEGGTVEVRGDLSLVSEDGYRPGQGHLTVLCGDGPQAVTDTSYWSYLRHVVNAHEDESEVSLCGYSGVYIHDPSYQTGDRYIQIASINNVTYTGEPIDPTVRYGTLELVKDQDYRVVDTHGEDLAAPGSHAIDIEGIASYKGSKTFTYQVERANVKFSTVSEIEDVIYDGLAHEPTPTVTMNERALTKGTDYTLVYTNNKNVGTATVRIEGRGGYTGNTQVTFNILPTPEGQRLIDLIDTLDPDALTLGDEATVAGIRSQYDALSAIDRESVTNLSKLTQAESIINYLHITVEDANGFITDAEALLAETPVSLDGSELEENVVWVTQDQAGALSAAIATLAETINDSTRTLNELDSAVYEFLDALGEFDNARNSQHGLLHKAGDPVEENLTKPTCTEDGSHDMVTHCVYCDEELSREQETLPALGHDYQTTVVEPTWSEQGYTRHTCSRCDDTYDDAYTDSLMMQGVRDVEQLIDSLPAPHDLTLVDADAVDAAHAAYAALVDEQVPLVSNFDKLETAVVVIADLRAAKAVDDAIAALPDPQDISLEDQALVDEACALFDALTEQQQGLVTQADKLDALEQTLAELFETLPKVGGCTWTLSDDGELTISPIPGRTTGTLPDSWVADDGAWLWSTLLDPAAVTSLRVTDGTIAGTSIAHMLGSDEASFVNLTSADLSSLDCSATEDMSHLFEGCSALTDIAGIASLVSSQVTDADGMFADCSSLVALDLSSWDVTGIAASGKTMASLFAGCDALEEAKLGEAFTFVGGALLPGERWTDGARYLTPQELSNLAGQDIAWQWHRYAPFDIAACDPTTIADQLFEGTPVEPVVELVHAGTTLAEDVDYSLSYENNDAPGQAWLVATGTGRFGGTLRIAFRIVTEQDVAVETMLRELQAEVDAAQQELDDANAELDRLYDTYITEPDVDALSDTAFAMAQELSQALVRQDEALQALASAEAALAPLTEDDEGYAEAVQAVNDARAAYDEATESVENYQGAAEESEYLYEEGLKTKQLFDNARDAIQTAGYRLEDKKDEYTNNTNLWDATVSEVSPRTYTGDTIKPDVTVQINGVTLRKGVDYDLRYEQNTYPGRGYITISGKAPFHETRQQSFTIEPKPLSDVAAATLPNATYTGESQTPQPVLKDGGVTLAVGTDYEIVGYENNVDAGTATVLLEGRRGYEGALPLTFAINRASLHAAEVTVSPTSFTYTGSAHKPTVKATLNDRELKAGVDYDVTYADNINAGEAHAVVTGKGNYTDSAPECLFTIGPAKATITASDKTLTAGKTAKLNASVTAGAGKLTYASSNPKVAKVSADGTVTAVAAGKATITVSSAKTNNYQAASKKVTITVNAALKRVPAPKGVKVTYNGKKQSLKAGEGYTLSGTTSGTNAGTYTATAKLKSGYVWADGTSASKKVTLTIAAAPIGKAKVASIGELASTGKPLKPTPEVTLGGKTLKLGTDYTLTYANNTKPGKATLTVKGKGNYSGSVKATFTIKDRWQRLAGSNATATMQAITAADGVFTAKTVSTVVVSGRRDFKAALAGTGLAGLNKAPLLITEPTALSGPTKAELQRLKPAKVLVCGDTSVVGTTAFNEIKACVPGARVQRVAGVTPSATANAIHATGKSAAVKWGRTAVVATQASFKDALSIAPYAYAKHAPIFFTESTKMGDGKTLSPETLATIKAGGFTRVLIVGGELAVPRAVESQLKGIARQRLAGANAIETSRLIGQFELKEGMTRQHLAVATTQDFADALAGAALAGAQNSVLILANQTGGYAAFDALADSKEIQHGHILGGTFALSEASEAHFRTR